MNINGVLVSRRCDDQGNMILSINDTEIFLTPDVLAQSWEIQESKDLTSIRTEGSGWKKKLYDYMLNHPHENNVFLISALLS